VALGPVAEVAACVHTQSVVTRHGFCSSPIASFQAAVLADGAPATHDVEPLFLAATFDVISVLMLGTRCDEQAILLKAFHEITVYSMVSHCGKELKNK
jgi:hypothetical protein